MKSKEEYKILTAFLDAGMFIANVKIMKEVERINSIFDDSVARKWYYRYGHINVKDLNKLSTKKW